ncbi:MAG: hypothetical protein IIU30_08060, partial [Treponema sp.]|nr:hypothetical protein [Treponema sp.]
ANFEFYICSRKIGSQRFLPRKKASALRLCRIFFGSKIASANFSAALRKLEIEPYKIYRKKSEDFFLTKAIIFGKRILTLYFIYCNIISRHSWSACFAEMAQW